MLALTPAVQIFLATEPTDMRKSIDGLSAIVQNQWGADVYSGHLFAFVSRRGDRVKILTWSSGGFVLYYKRLEKGRGSVPAVEAEAVHVALDATQLAMLLDGLDLARVKQPRRWTPPAKVQRGIDKAARI